MKFPTLLHLLPLAVLLAVPMAARAQSEKALNFYSTLLKRPAAGALFEQFYDAWVDADTVEKLESFLTTQAEKSPDARMVLAVFHARQGALEKSAEEWRRAVKDAPQRADTWLALAETEARLRRTAEALEAVERGLKTRPAPDLQRRLLEFKGRTLARNGKRAEARAAWESLLNDHPDDQDLREDYIDLLAETGDNDAAVQAARELADATTDPYRRVLRRAKVGDLLARQDAGDKAIAEYAAALADTGGGSWLERDLLRQIESVFRRGDRVQDLSGFTEKLAAKEPQRLAVRRLLARLLTEQDKKEEAQKVWRGLLQSAPGDRELAESFIQSLTESARHSEAAEQWRALIKLHPGEAELHLKLAAALHAAKDDAGCATAVREFLNAGGGAEETSLRAAAELSKFKLPAASVALLAETAQKFPASEQARLQYASALHTADKKDDARAAWRSEAALPGRLLAAARAALAHGEHALTWELLEPRLADFANDAPALTFICEAAQREEKWQAGTAQAQRLVALAADPIALSDALTLALRMADRGHLTPSLRKDLEARRAELLPAEKCLLAELLHSSGDRAAATALLEEVSTREPELGLALLVRLHAAAKEFAAAVRAQQRIVDSPGGRKTHHVQRLAELCTAAKQFTEALRWTNEWKKLAPGSTAPWLKEATLLSDSGRTAEAARTLQQASHLWPDDTDILARFATMLAATGQAARAQQIYLRLFEKVESTQEKLRWLTPLTETARSINQLESLMADFQRRREQNRHSAVPLLALAECHRLRGDHRARLEFMREAARLGQGDPELLMRAAESAVQNGLLEVAESMLSEAGAMDKSGASIQQRIAVLLQLERSTEAAALLSQLAAGLNPDDSAELALALSDAGHAAAAGAFLREVAARFPDNYRLAWLAAHFTGSGGDDATALEEYLRLATAPFAPMPDAPDGQQPGLVPAGASLLTPQVETMPSPISGSDDEKVAVLRAMQEPTPWVTRQGAYDRNVPRVPGPPWQLRGWAAGHALRLAQVAETGRVAAVKEKLLAAGFRPAIFSEATAGSKLTDAVGGVSRADFAIPDEDRGWVLRFLLGPLRRIEDLNGQAFIILGPNLDTDARGPFALEAWHRFRESDPAYAVHAALMLMDSNVAAEREAASAALALLEAHDPPGALLPGVILPLHTLATRDQPADDRLSARLLARLTPWHRSTARGLERDWLRHLLLTQVAKGDDPAAYLNLVAEEIAAGSPGEAFATATLDTSLSRMLQSGARQWNVRRGMQQIVQQSAWASGGFPSAYPQTRPAQSTPPSPSSPLPGPGATSLLLPPVLVAVNNVSGGAAYDGPLVRAASRLKAGPWSSDAAKLRAAVEQCPHTGVKALASLLLNDESLTSPCMEALTTEQPPVPEHLMVAAAWEWRHQRAEPAIALLERAAKLEPDNSPKAADTGIVAALNLLLWAQEPVTDAMKSAARAALEHMAAQSLAAEHRGSLAAIAEALGWPELTPVIFNAPAIPIQQPAASTGAPRAQPLASLMYSLQNARRGPARGARGQAQPAGQVAQQLLAAARSVVVPPTSYFYQQTFYSQGGQFAGPGVQPSLPQDVALSGEVVAELEKRAAQAKDGTGTLTAGVALLRYAGVEKALPVIARALAFAPEDQRLRGVAAREVAKKSLAAVKKLAEPLAATNRADIFEHAILSLRPTSVSELPTVFEAAEEWLAALRAIRLEESRAPGRGADGYTSNNWGSVLQTLEVPFPFGKPDPVLPPFLPNAAVQPGQSAPSIKPGNEPLAVRRREVITSLYLELLRFPEVAPNMMDRIEKAVQAGHMKWETRRADALGVMQIPTEPDTGVPVFVESSSSTSAVLIVLQEAVRDPQWLEGTALPALRRVGKKKAAAGFSELLPMLTCAPQEFAAVADRFANAAPEGFRFQYLCQAASIARQRRVETAMPDLVGKGLAIVNGGSIPAGLVFTVVRQLHAQGGQAAVNAWVEKSCGEPQAQDIWTRPLSPQAITGMGFTVLSGLLNNSQSNAADTLAALRLHRALEQSLRALPPEIPARLSVSLMDLKTQPPAADVIAILEAAGFLADLPDFRLVLLVTRPGPAYSDYHSQGAEWLLQAVQQAGKNEPSTPLLDLLEKEHAHTFGGRVAAAILREARAGRQPNGAPNPMVPDVLLALTADLPRLKALPEDRQLEFLSLGHRWVANDHQSTRAAREWQSGLQRIFWQRRFNALQAMSDKELAADSSGLSAQLTAILTNVLPFEPENVMRLLARVSSLQNPVSLQGTSVPDLVAGAVANWSYDAPPQTQAQRLRAILHIVCEPQAGAPEPHRVMDHCEGLLQRWLLPDKPLKLPESLDLLLKRLESVPDDFLTEAQARALLPAAAKIAVFASRTGDFQKTAAQAASALEGAGPGGRLRKVLACAFRLSELNFRRNEEVRTALTAARKFIMSAGEGYVIGNMGDSMPLTGVASAAALPECQRRLLESFTDPVLPLSLRRTFVTEPAKLIPRFFDPPLLIAAASLLEGDPESGKDAGPRRSRIAAALASAATHFIPPASEEYRAVERRIISALLEGAASGPGFDGRSLAVAARSADDDTLLNVVRAAAGQRDTPCTGVFRTLVNLRRFDAARILLTEAPDKIFPDAGAIHDSSELYAPETPAAVRDFLATLPEGPLPSAAAASMADAYDAPGLAAAKGTSREERLEILARSLAEKDLSLEWLRRVLPVFGESSTRRNLEPLLEKAVRGSALPEIIAAPRQMQTLYYRYLTGKAERGTLEPLRQAARELSEVATAQRSKVTDTIWQILAGALRHSGAEWPPPAQQMALEIMRLVALDAAEAARRINNGETEPLETHLALCQVMHAAWNAMAECEAGWRALEEDQRVRLSRLPGTAQEIIEFLRLPHGDLVPEGKASALPVELTGPKGTVLARLVASEHGFPDLFPGMLHDFVVSEKDIDPAPLLALAPELTRRADAVAAAARVDVTLLLAMSDRTEEARACLPSLDALFRTIPGERTLAVFVMHLHIRHRIDGAESALTWALQNGPRLTENALKKRPRGVSRLHLQLNLAESALLKLSGPDTWRQQVLTRLAAAPESPLAVFYAACALEKFAEAESAAGRKQEAMAAMSLAILTAARVDELQPALLDSSSREIFTANYADHAQRAGEQVEFVELLPFGAEWLYSCGPPDPNDALNADNPFGPEAAGRAPLGWDADGLARIIRKPQATKTGPDPSVQFKTTFTISDKPSDSGFGTLYSVFCDLEDPVQGFTLNGSTLGWSDSGRPERAPDLPVLSKNPQAAAGAVNVRTTLLGPQWVKHGQNSLSIILHLKDRKRQALRFDAALYALKLTFPQAVAQAQARRADLENAAPEFWRKLPAWVRGK